MDILKPLYSNTDIASAEAEILENMSSENMFTNAFRQAGSFLKTNTNKAGATVAEKSKVLNMLPKMILSGTNKMINKSVDEVVKAGDFDKKVASSAKANLKAFVTTRLNMDIVRTRLTSNIVTQTSKLKSASDKAKDKIKTKIDNLTEQLKKAETASKSKLDELDKSMKDNSLLSSKAGKKLRNEVENSYRSGSSEFVKNYEKASKIVAYGSIGAATAAGVAYGATASKDV